MRLRYTVRHLMATVGVIAVLSGIGALSVGHWEPLLNRLINYFTPGLNR
jgi:hypothetical protein